MTRGPLSFKEADLKRAVKSARAAGLQISSVEVTKAGNIIVHVASALRSRPQTTTRGSRTHGRISREEALPLCA